MYASIAESKKMEEKSGVGRSLDVLEGLLAKQDSAEERKAIEKDLDSMQAYFSSLSKAESEIEKAFSKVTSEEEAQEDTERRQALMGKGNQIKRRLAASIRMEQRKLATQRVA